MRRINVTESFRMYREAARLLWNVFLIKNPDRELDFLDVDSPLFHAIIEGKLNVGLEPVDGKTPYFADLNVVAADRRALLLDENNSSVNVWLDRALPKNVTLKYSGLFDFATDSAYYRDFKYIKCVGKQGVWLVDASVAKIYFLNP